MERGVSYRQVVVYMYGVVELTRVVITTTLPIELKRLCKENRIKYNVALETGLRVLLEEKTDMVAHKDKLIDKLQKLITKESEARIALETKLTNILNRRS